MTDLSHWDHALDFSFQEVAGLIVGIDPTAVTPESAEWRRAEPVKRRMLSSYLPVLNWPSVPEQERRWALYSIEARLALDAGLTMATSDHFPSRLERHHFRREDVVTWLEANRLRSVYRFAEAISPASAEGLTVQGWPWGNHHTENLGHLEAAARQWWVNYDPTDSTTGPTNAEVSEWLQKGRGVSRTMADAIASMLRADDLPTGPRR